MEGIDDIVFWIITSPLSQLIISTMMRRVQHWEAGSHVTDTGQDIFSKNTIVLGYLSSKIKNNSVSQNIFYF